MPSCWIEFRACREDMRNVDIRRGAAHVRRRFGQFGRGGLGWDDHRFLASLRLRALKTPQMFSRLTLAGTARCTLGDLIRFNNQGSYYPSVPSGVATTNGQPQAFYQPPLSATLSPAPPVGTYTIDPATSNWQLAAVAGGSGMNSPPDGFYRYQILPPPVPEPNWRRDTTRIDHRRSEFFWLRFAMSAIEPFMEPQLFPYGFSYSFQPLWDSVGRPGVLSSSDCPFGSSNPSDTSSIVISFAPSGAIDTSGAGTTVRRGPGNVGILPYPIRVPLSR